MDSRADKMLHEAGAMVGDHVRIRDEGRTFEGVVMPRHGFSDPAVLIVKLASGYNVGIALGDKVNVELVRAAEPRRHAAKAQPKNAGKPTVALLGTGGTIASFVDYRTGAVHPAATAEELAFATPEIFDVANIESEVVYQVFSEDLEPKNWTELAQRVKAAFDRGARGVVIPHGTDTLAYTSAALAFALDDLPGPVVLVGAQRSSDRPSSDAASNLVAAVRVAAEADLAECVVVMHAGSSDGTHAILRGTRARKNHTSRRDAFESVNIPPLGHVKEDRIELTNGNHRRRGTGPCKVRPNFDPRVRLIWSTPLTQLSDFRTEGMRGFVLAGTGLGHVPKRCLDGVRAARQAGVLQVMTSQCLWGRVNMDVYSAGRDLQAAGVRPAHDMLPETALVKLMWALGQASDREAAWKLFETLKAGEFDPVTPFEVD